MRILEFVVCGLGQLRGQYGNLTTLDLYQGSVHGSFSQLRPPFFGPQFSTAPLLKKKN